MNWFASRTAVLLFLTANLLQARDWKSLKPQGYLSDFANVVDAGSKAKLEAYSGTVERATGSQLAFVTLQSLDGEAIEDVANDIYRGFGIGQKGKDNGVLLLLAVSEKRFRLEIGNGLEPILPDGLDGQILTEMRPALRAGEFGQAMLYAAQRVGTILAQDKGVTLPAAAPPRRQRIQERSVHSIPWPLLLGAVVLFFLFARGGGGGGGFLTGMLLGGMMGGGGRRYGGGGGYGGFGGSDGGGGGFGGFGGGSSGGGGASSDW